MISFDPDWYKHLPRFGRIIHKCHFPNKSVNHSETSYAVPEDYKDDSNFLQHCSLRLSHYTDQLNLVSSFPQFYYFLDWLEAAAYNQPQPFVDYLPRMQ